MEAENVAGPNGSVPGVGTRPSPWTSLGLLHLTGGTIASALALPPAGAAGATLAVLVGVVMLLVGRRVHGPAHGKQLTLALILYIVGFGASMALGVVLVASFLDAFRTTDVVGFHSRLVYVVGVAGALGGFTGLANVLVTYSLQGPLGRRLLWVGYGAGLAAVALGYLSLGRTMEATVAYQGAPPAAVLGPLPLIAAVLRPIPPILFGFAYGAAWVRVRRLGGPQRSPTAAPGQTAPAAGEVPGPWAKPCPRCSTPLAVGYSFCPSCGTLVTA